MLVIVGMHQIQTHLSWVT